MTGAIVYHPNLVAPDGSLGVYRLQYQTAYFEFEELDYVYGAVAASMPLLDNNLAYHPWREWRVELYERERARYDDSRIEVLLQEEIFPDVDFTPLNVGEGYGFCETCRWRNDPILATS